MTTIALTAMLLLSGVPAPGTTTTVNSAAAVQQAARPLDQNQRVCVRSQDPTGTILTRSVCRTRAEWDRTGGLSAQVSR